YGAPFCRHLGGLPLPFLATATLAPGRAVSNTARRAIFILLLVATGAAHLLRSIHRYRLPYRGTFGRASAQSGARRFSILRPEIFAARRSLSRPVPVRA